MDTSNKYYYHPHHQESNHSRAAEMRALLDAAIESNNLGVRLLCEKRLEDALLCFKSAARMMHPVSQFFHYTRVMRTMFASAETAGQHDPSMTPALDGFDGIFHASVLDDSAKTEVARNGTNKSRGRPTPHQHHQRPSVPQHHHQQAATTDTQLMTSDKAFIVCEPIVIDKTNLHYGEGLASCTLEASAIVFNMGLVYRLSGSNESLLMRAWSMFDMAFSLVFSVNPEAQSSKIGLACMNNAAEAQHALGNYRLSHRYLDILYSTILSLPPPIDDESFKERHQLLLNVMLLREPTKAGAA